MNIRGFSFILAVFAVFSFRVLAADIPIKALIVTAHPDDESEMAATTYRIVKELNGTVDQVIITDGEAGFRYSQLAEKLYRTRLTNESVGRAQLPAIRRREVLAAGRILGIRHHIFLNQKDTRYTTNAADVLNGAWNQKFVLRVIERLLRDERYNLVLTLLPTNETHGHHQAATLLALESVESLPEVARPIVVGVETVATIDSKPRFPARHDYAAFQTISELPVFTFDRNAQFGFRDALSYQIVVNWVIAEHKSQGLFQTEYGKHAGESFWLFNLSGPNARKRAAELFREIAPDEPSRRSVNLAGLR